MEPGTQKPDEPRTLRRRKRRYGPFSSLRARILAINMLALVILAAGLLYLDQHQRGLFAAKIEALTTEGEIIAGALGESAVRGDDSEELLSLDEEAARVMLGRLVGAAGTRARLFDGQGELVVDTQLLAASGALVEARELPDPEERAWIVRLGEGIYSWVIGGFPPRGRFPPYREAPEQRAVDYAEVMSALLGEGGSAIRDAGEDGLVVSVALPVQRFKQVHGALFLSAGAEEIEQSVREVRSAILKAFGIALGITVLLSLYLARTIARPVRLLARAADRVRAGQGRKVDIPDFTRRGDEIGDLSAALREMTEALWKRMDAIEQFAADVAHEIKNPLTSVRTAVETASRLPDAKQKEKLMNIILDDVKRLDRLITDISDASRLDAELSRAEAAPVDLAPMIETMVEVHEAARKAAPEDQTPRLAFERGSEASYVVMGLEDRLVQVFRNLINNALSFSPPRGTITMGLAREGEAVRLTVHDEGPGIPVGGEQAIFERFYSLRPEGEGFGTHSGLGLSIAKQIVEAHGGTITASNRTDDKGQTLGARFVVRLPA